MQTAQWWISSNGARYGRPPVHTYTYIYVNLYHIYMYTCVYTDVNVYRIYMYTCVHSAQWLLGSLKTYVSFAKEPYKRDDIL